MPTVQRYLGLARFTFDLGTPLLWNLDVQDGALQSGPLPHPPAPPSRSSFVSPAFALSSFQLHHCSSTPHTSPLRVLSSRSLSCQNAVWLCPNAVKSFFPSYFSSRCDSDSKLTKVALEQCFSFLLFIITTPKPQGAILDFFFFSWSPPCNILVPQIRCLFMYYMYFCALDITKYAFYHKESNSTLTDWTTMGSSWKYKAGLIPWNRILQVSKCLCQRRKAIRAIVDAERIFDKM